MSMKSVHIPALLHQELTIFATQKGQTLGEAIRQLLQESLRRERLKETYQAMAQEYDQMAEESAYYVTEVLDPGEDWDEYQNA